MDRFPAIAGWIVGLLLIVGLFSLIPAPKCRDGWDSPSIGRQGACSHHGGVRRHGGLVFLAIAAGFGAGLFTTTRLSAVVERRKKEQFKRSLVPPSADAPVDKIILYAILSESKVEFMYKGHKDLVPAMRIVSPAALTTVRGPYGRSSTPCVVGHCHTRNASRTFALDRISRLKLLGA